MTSDQGTLKIYSDRTYTRTTMVRHQGTALAFAMDERRRIVYTVLDLSAYDEDRGELDAAYWSESPQDVPFPDELVTVGYSVVGATAMPVVKKGGRTEAGAGEELAPEETDRFLSTTARLSADAPFQVVSDGTHVVLLRQAIGASDTDAVFKLANGAASGNTARTDFQLAGTAKIPVVADTLLCDRFLLVGNVLKPVSEVRFKRSRHKTRPASVKDSLGATDMDGKPFHEPTQQLEFIRNLTQGRFTAVLTPTAVQGQQRWQFFAHNTATGRIDSFNVEQAADGLFNTQGSRYWTSPDARYRGSVYERAPGICPFTNLSLVPITPDIPHPETALQFNGTSQYLNMGAAPALKFQGRSYAVEAWVKPRAAGGPVLARWSGTASQGGFQLRITNTGQVALDHSGGTLTSLQNIPADTWAHIAASFDGTTATLYVNGAFSGDKALPSSGDGSAMLHIGAKAGGPFYSGVIDEVRIWNRSRGQSEIADSSHYRLIGNEPGLVAYYRFDEGSGTTAYDQTDTAAHATLDTPPQWVTSQAPVGEHPGVRRDSFTLSGRDIVSGLSATLYYQQEDAVAGYQDDPKPAKRNARVLLACATRPAGNATADAHIATVDFGVGIDGRLADIPDVVTLAELGRPVEQTSDLVSAQQQIVTGLEQQATAIQTEITSLTGEKTTLEQAIAASNNAAANDPARWIVQLSWNGSVLAPAGGALTQGTLVGLWDRNSRYTRWRLVRAGSASRYSNPTYALVNDSAPGMGVHTVFRNRMGADTYGAEFQPLNTAEVHQQWYVRGTWNTSVQFQNAGQDVWMGVLSWFQLRDEKSAVGFTVEKVGVIPDTTLQAKVDRLAVVNALLAQRNRDLVAKQAEIPPAREELARRTATLLGEADLVLPVPHIGLDVRGLSSAGALLKFARTAATPYLMDSAAGRVALYFQGANGQFFAAYLDTSAERGSQQLAGGGLTALFTARDPGVVLSGTQIRITDCTVNGAAAAGLCDLTITRGTDSETFTRLPRRIQDLAAAVNGATDEPLSLGTATGATGDQLTLARALPVAVPVHSHLLIGESAHLVTTVADTGGTTLRVTPAPATPLAQGTEVSLIRYDTARATSSRPGTSLAQGSCWITVGADKRDVLVPNGTATALVAGHGSRWRGDAPGRAVSLNGTSHGLVMGGTLDSVAVTGDLTAEAWINPRRVSTPRSRVFHVRTGDTRAAIALSPEPTTGGMVLNGTDAAMAIPGADPTGTDFTIECWLKRTTGRTVADTIVALGANGLNVGFTSSGAFTFGFTGQTLTTTATYTDGEWHHWAVTFDRTTRAQVILRDGAVVAQRTATTVPSGTGQLIVGRSDTGTFSYFSGRLAELRTWNTARSATDIAADQNRRVAPNEPGLTGAWLYDGSRPQLSQFPDISGQGRHGGVWGTAAASESAVKGYKILAAVGDKHRTSRETYLCGEWAHVAAVYEQSWALRFNGSAWADTPDADALDLTEDLTIEVFAHIDAIGLRQGLVSKGRLGDGTGATVPYQLSVLANGKLEFAFEEPGPRIIRYTSDSALTAGFHRIAVVRKAGSSSDQVKGTRTISYKDENGTTQNRTVDTIDHVDTKSWDDIRFVVDGAETGTGRYTGTGPRGNDGALEIGRIGEGSALYPLTGTIGEIRIWGKARETNQLGSPLHPRDEGLIARWTFEENTGNTTADLAGGYDLRLHGAKWAADPNPAAGSFTVYRNGRSVPCDTPATNPLADWGLDRFSLGTFRNSTQTSEYFDGTLDDVRYWRTARTPEQILDNLFTRIKGDKQDLIGYWTFDPTANEAADVVLDQGLRGNHLYRTGDKVPSTAPISTDTAAVRSALAGIRTPFHQNISTPPAATEYADLQYTATGEAQGVLKRCYTHTAAGAWHLTTGYKVGDLVSEWVSQVQFDPQLIGYIEGAPPVPSENLTGQIDPAGSSSVTFNQADEVVSTLSSTHERSIDASFSMAAGAEVDEKILMITAPLGIGTAQPLASVTVKGHIGGSMEFSNAWTDETSVGQGTSTTHDTSATLTGAWEDPTRILNSAVGRRFLPANKGYALVQSETADVYALRLAHSGALVAYRILPNPDIPKDWNIITFPINPQYTKQGTLDGAVGFNDQGKVLDPAYPNAFQRGEYSYFKPREAYAIKRRILRERQELETYYSTVSTETSDSDPTAERAAKVLAPIVGTKDAAEKAQPVEAAGSFANRNIANTYVWTADGGFFAETTGTVDVVTETTGGSYSLSGAVTGSLEVGFDVAGVGVGLQFDASLGGGMTTTRHRSKEATRSHSLDVVCNPSGDLQKYDSSGKAQYTAAGAPVLVAGKVDAYRFMTFYLGQDTSHFNDFYNKVADPIWLETSNDPNASALREARHSDRTPPCWRILHRVTFVSRILPPVPATTAPPLEQKMRTIDVASNYELIRRLDPYVSTATSSQARLADATRTALTEHLPQLLPHALEITLLLAEYYDVTE
ncbi:LamG domain-containing protein [Streptomyces yaizuensis]|uniref:Laminin G domain-containing protein n=1 Tax=Streptomyces yaizuensis TaxID=2989713 RepID=A0ABQ5NS31_9ACTN|nr:LamG domain-containing protein [Streptomyces sp. YSPA8]GLF92948.1 laminin G domain-containing protein [Streptomyces sp. YSPA8]